MWLWLCGEMFEGERPQMLRCWFHGCWCEILISHERCNDVTSSLSLLSLALYNFVGKYVCITCELKKGKNSNRGSLIVNTLAILVIPLLCESW